MRRCGGCFSAVVIRMKESSPYGIYSAVSHRKSKETMPLTSKASES